MQGFKKGFPGLELSECIELDGGVVKQQLDIAFEQLHVAVVTAGYAAAQGLHVEDPLG